MSRWWTILLLLAAVGAGVFVWVVEPGWRSSRDEDALRGALLRISPNEIRGIRIRTGDQSIEIERRDDGWRIGPEPLDRASIGKVSELVNAAVNLHAIDMIDQLEFENDLDLDDYGLREPKSQVDFIGDGEETLYFGKEASTAGRVYVRLGESKDVFVVDDALQQLIALDPQEFRDRRLTGLVPDQVDRFVVKRGGGEMEVVRGPKGWEIVRPLQAPADSKRIEAVLGAVLGAEIQAFVSEESDDLSVYGMTEPRAEIALTVEGIDHPVVVRVGADAAADADGVMAQFSERGSVYELPRVVLQALQVTPDSLRDRHFISLNPDTIDAIRVIRGGDASLIEREGDDWKDADGRIAADAVEKFVAALNDAEVEDYVPLTPQALADADLAKPALRISFDAWLSENTPEAVAGRHSVLRVDFGKIADGRVWTRVGESPELRVIPSEVLELIPRGAAEPVNTSAP